MKTNFILILLYLPFVIFAQHGQQNNSINITVEELKDHMYYLASDALKGRMPGEEGYLKAVEYAVTQFKQSSLKPLFINENGDSTYLQAIQFEKHTWDSSNTMVIWNNNSKQQQFKQGINYVMVMGKPFDVTKVEGEVVFVSAGIREPDYGLDNYANADVKGKWVVTYINVRWLDKFLPQTVIKEKYTNPATYNKLVFQNAREAGAIGVLAIADKQYSANFKMLAKVFNQQILAKKVSDTFFNAEFPVVLLDSAITASLFTEPGNNPSVNDTLYNSFELKNMSITLNKNAHLQEFESYNVGAMYPGNDPTLKEEYITVGAHLDHIGTMDDLVFNGADDNASGSIGVIEIAEEIAQKRPKRPVLFLLFTAEEMGLIGSEFYVLQPPVPLSQIKININLDMISRSDGDVAKGIAPMILDKSSNLKNELIETYQKFPYVELDWAYADSSAISGLSDHFSFHKRSIPTVFFSSGLHSDYHNIGDDAEKVDYEFFMKNCHLIYQLVYDLSNKEKLQLLTAE
jgi:hypothetical protein